MQTREMSFIWKCEYPGHIIRQRHFDLINFIHTHYVRVATFLAVTHLPLVSQTCLVGFFDI